MGYKLSPYRVYELELIILLDTLGALLTSYINIFTPEDIKVIKGACRSKILFSLHFYIFIITEYLRSRIGILSIIISISLSPKKFLVVKIAYPR